MILAVDVHYREEFAKVVSIEFDNWDAPLPSKVNELFLTEVAAYVSGEFYKRELPCILEILEKTNQEELDCIIVDGFVFLDDEGKAGLGKYLYEALEGKIPIVGVAKRGFATIEKDVIEVVRGESKNPLFVTSVGMELEVAASRVKNMVGKYRMPTLLQLLDGKTKEGKV